MEMLLGSQWMAFYAGPPSAPLPLSPLIFPSCLLKATTHGMAFTYIVSILDLCQLLLPWIFPVFVCSFYANLQSANYTLLKVFFALSYRTVRVCASVCVLVNGKLKNSIQTFPYTPGLCVCECPYFSSSSPCSRLSIPHLFIQPSQFPNALQLLFIYNV